MAKVRDKMRRRCIACGKRVRLFVDFDFKRRIFTCFCPKCGSHDKNRLITKK